MECLQESYLARLHREHKERQARLNQAPVQHSQPKPKPKLVSATDKRVLPPGLRLRKINFDGHAPLLSMLGLIADYFGESTSSLLGPDRYYRISRVRNIACYVLYNVKKPKISTVNLGAFMGGRDHSTIITAMRRVTAICARDPITKQRVAEVSCMCRQLKWPKWS